MQQVVSQIRLVQLILGEHKLQSGIPYRLSIYCLRNDRSEGVLLYQVLTGELLLLTHEEAALLEALPGPVPAPLSDLAARWFLRPVDADDMVLADQVREIATRLRKRESAFTQYSILTTTACNARCFYCFEGGWKTNTMTEQTAMDVAHFISTRCEGKRVRIKWFGGEPLVNARAIDIIADELVRLGVDFRSTITSNGFLFDEAMARRARDCWKLDAAQITLDGTEEVYNRTKAYINAQGSPYRRVLRNIGLLLDAGVKVNVRLNVTQDNVSDLYALVDELEERFAGRPGFGVYCMMIMEDVGINPISYTGQERLSYAEKIESLRDYIEHKGMANRLPLKQKLAVNACQADSDSFTAIAPDGRLVRCETDVEDSVWGSIYSDDTDEEVIQQWKECKPLEAGCKYCAAYPRCKQLKKCPGMGDHCTPIDQTTRVNRIYRTALGAYEKWKTVGGE